MAQVFETVEIHAPPRAGLGARGRPRAQRRVVPALAASTLDHGYRYCTTQAGAEIVERILDHSDGERYYVYELASSPLPTPVYRSLLAVEGHGDHSHVIWQAEFEAESPDLEPELAGTFGEIYREGLAALRDRLEVAAAA